MQNKIYSKDEADKAAQDIQPQLDAVHSNLRVSVQKRIIKPLNGNEYPNWVLFFSCGDIQFSMDPTIKIEGIRKAFLDASK